MHKILDYNFGKQTQMPLLLKFCLLCETIDDQRRSTRRLHDVDTNANDLRHEMALESVSVLMKVKLRTTANMRAGASNGALTSTSLSLHKSGSNGLSHTMKEFCPPLRSLLQSVELEYERSAPVVQVSQHIPRIPNPATEASSVRASQPRCTSYGFTPWIHSTESHYIERRIFLCAPEVD